jgi:hypothetical protein
VSEITKKPELAILVKVLKKTATEVSVQDNKDTEQYRKDQTASE